MIYNRIIHSDCLDIMREMPDKSIDLVLTDPPYGININHNMGRRKGDKNSEYKPAVWDNKNPNELYFNEMFRVSKNQIIWGANYFISKMPFDSSCWLIWDKLFSEDLTFSQFEMAYTSFNTTCKKFVLNPSANNNRFHPTQKPVKLFEWCLKNYSNENDLILDCFSGSGTTAIACHNLNRRFICIEKDKEYYEKSVIRYEKHIQQIKMFI